MSAPSPRVPSPADLARIRRARTPPRPSRGRHLAEVENQRARRALRTLVADPAADFATLDDDAFFAALRCACQESTVNPALIAHVERRVAEGTATSRDLHQVLFIAGDDVAWQHSRTAAMAAVAHQPHLAVEVVHLEVQRLGAPPPRVTESADQGGFTAHASLDRGGVTVEGWPCCDTTKKRASQRALVSLLVELTGIPVDAAMGLPMPAGSEPTRAQGPGEDTPSAPHRRSAPVSRNGGEAPTMAAPATSPEDLEAWLDHMVGRPGPDPELAAHLAAGRLTPRALYLLLFEADPSGWRQHRAHAWSALVATPSQAPGVLSMCTQARCWPPAGCMEMGAGTAVAYVTTPEGPVVGEPAIAGGLRAARASAALALVRDLAPPIQGDGAPEPAIGGGNPVSLLNERAQIGVVGNLTFTQDTAGPAHRPVFTCTASCLHSTQHYTSTAEAGSKNEAKTAAAAGLLEQIVAAEQTHLARLARARREQARSPEGIFSRLARAGCPVEFTGQGLRITGHLAEPLAGCELPLLSALPILATLDGPIDPTARTWASATKVALEAVAARRVYPALDGDGRDCWRLAPHVPTPAPDPAIAQFFDAIAETLLRPPGAPLVIGDRPYAGHPRPLDPEAVDWADRAAEAAEGTAPAHLMIRLGLPEGDGRPLRAHLRTGRSPEASPSGGGRFDEGLLTRAEQRLLRRAARDWPPLERVRSQGMLTGAESAQLLGPAGERLAALGITVEWPAELLTPGTVAAHISVAPRSATGSGTFSLADAADLTWQLDLNGEPLTEQETRAAADAVAGVLQLRGRWVVLDAETQQRARDPRAGRLCGAQALAAALTGQVTVGGRDIACCATEALADLVAVLRGAGSGPHDVVLPGGLETTLRDYQRRGVQWLVRMTSAGFGALLADDMGLGKT
ncbi:MAG TPA: SNF2 helicase-associated domain-containing protein, partial [Streptosporangiaceae bacterium]